MDGVPCAALVARMRALGAQDGGGLGAAPVQMRLGRVTGTAPLTVNVAGTNMPPSALRVNERLVKGAKWKARITSPNSDFKGLTGPVSGPVSTPDGQGSLIELTDGSVHSPDVTIDGAAVEQLELDLGKGDEVLLLTQDDQVFYIIMKVVKAV